MVLVFQIQDVAAHGGLIELRRIAADTRGQFAQIPRVIFLRGGGQTAQFEQFRIADLRRIIGDERDLGRAALLGGFMGGYPLHTCRNPLGGPRSRLPHASTSPHRSRTPPPRSGLVQPVARANVGATPRRGSSVTLAENYPS